MVRLFRKAPKEPPMHERYGSGGMIIARLMDENGNPKPRMPGLSVKTWEQKVHNAVTQFQRDLSFYYIASAVPNAAGFCWIGVGDGATAAATNDTSLNYERGARVVATFTHVVAGGTYGMLATFPANNPATAYNLLECGMFATGTGTAATLGYRAIFATVNKATSDLLQLIWVVSEAIS